MVTISISHLGLVAAVFLLLSILGLLYGAGYYRGYQHGIEDRYLPPWERRW